MDKKGFSGRSLIRNVKNDENAVRVLILVFLIGLFSFLTKGRILQFENVTNVMIQSAARGMASIGQAFVILTGGIDLTPTGLGIMSVIIGGYLMTRGTFAQGFYGPQLPLAATLPIILAIGVGIGSVNGLFVSRAKIPPFIVTLAMWQITKGFSIRFTGGWGIGNLPEGYAFFGQGDVLGAPVPIITFVVAMCIAYFVLSRTTFGRNVYAAGGNPAAAWLSGVNVAQVQQVVYIISGVSSAMAGIILSSRVMTASLYVANNLELDSIAAVIIGGVSLTGGRGSIIGVLIGVLIMAVINNAMNMMMLAPGFQDMTRGIIILVAVFFDMWRSHRETSSH